MQYKKQRKILLERIEETASTNEYLSMLCKDGCIEEFYTVLTEYQTAGKGQRGNTWESEKGKNLLFSFVLYPTAMEAKLQFYISMLVATAIVDTLSHYTEGFSVKWPNDIYWKDQKIAGILIENELEGKYISQCIVGIGLNVNQQTFHSSAPNPVSLSQIIGKEIDRDELFSKTLHALAAGYQAIEDNYPGIHHAIESLYRQKLYRRKGFFPYKDANGPFMAEFHQVAPDGHLYLKDEEGNIRRYAFKEVTYL